MENEAGKKRKDVMKDQRKKKKGIWDFSEYLTLIFRVRNVNSKSFSLSLAYHTYNKQVLINFSFEQHKEHICQQK